MAQDPWGTGQNNVTMHYVSSTHCSSMSVNHIHLLVGVNSGGACTPDRPSCKGRLINEINDLICGTNPPGYWTTVHTVNYQCRATQHDIRNGMPSFVDLMPQNRIGPS